MALAWLAGAGHQAEHVRVATAAKGAQMCPHKVTPAESSPMAELPSTKALPRAHHCPRAVSSIWQGQLRLCLGFAGVTSQYRPAVPPTHQGLQPLLLSSA